MNVSIFIGNLGHDASVKATPSGTTVAEFSVAVRNQIGRDAPAIWKRCEIWGRRAEALAPYLNKGTQVSIVAEEVEEHWTGRNGEARKGFLYKVTEISLLGKASDSSESSGGKQESPPPREPRQNALTPSDDVEEDVPF